MTETTTTDRVRQPRPHPISVNDSLLALVLDELEHQGALLAQILDRLPAPTVTEVTISGPIEVTEPAPAGPSTPDRPVEVTERAPAPRPPAKKATTKTQKEG